MPDKRRKPAYRWATAGVAVVVLAVFLAGFGLYFAISHTRLTAAVRIARVRDEAIRLRITANRHIRRASNDILDQIAGRFRAGAPGDLSAPPTGLPWVTETFIWEGHALVSQPVSGSEGGDSVGDPAFADFVAELLREHVGSLSPPWGVRPRYIRGEIGGQPVLLACSMYLVPQGDPFVAAVRIDVDRLKETFLDGHFSTSGRMHVVTKGSSSRRYWVEPIAPALNPLVIELAPTFIGSQQRKVIIHIALYAVVTVLFVTALSVMVWKFIRLVQREVTLSRLKTNFVADVSHELKTPLALIRMFSEMLSEDRVRSQEKKQEYYGIITRESTRLTHMIDNILDFSRIDAGKKQYDMQTVDIALVVQATYDAYRFDLDRHGFEHRLAIAHDLPRVNADPDAISQAILNLISNAMKYSQDEKRLVIDLVKETRRGKHGVLISVEDSGIGIRPEDRSHLFDGFFRAADDRVRRARGAGLGLSLVKNIIDAHGGSIDVEPRLVKGTTFRIFLPQVVPIQESQR